MSPLSDEILENQLNYDDVHISDFANYHRYQLNYENINRPDFPERYRRDRPTIIPAVPINFTESWCWKISISIIVAGIPYAMIGILLSLDR